MKPVCERAGPTCGSHPLPLRRGLRSTTRWERSGSCASIAMARSVLLVGAERAPAEREHAALEQQVQEQRAEGDDVLAARRDVGGGKRLDDTDPHGDGGGAAGR